MDESQFPQLSAFERVKHRIADGREWWSARELLLLLTYSRWQDFHKVIQVAIVIYLMQFLQSEFHVKAADV